MPPDNGAVLTGQNVDQMIKQIEAKVPPEKQKEFQSGLTAAMKMMWSDQTQHYMQKAAATIRGPQDVAPVVSEKIKKLINVAVVQASGSKKFMPTSFMVAQVCALQVLLYVQQNLHIPVTKEMLGQTMQMLSQKMIQMYGITPEMLNQLKASHQPSVPTRS